MKRLFALLSTPLMFLFPKLAFAQEAESLNLCPEGQFSAFCRVSSGDFGGIIGTAIIVIFIVAIINERARYGRNY